MQQRACRPRFLPASVVGLLLLLCPSSAHAQAAPTTGGRVGLGTSISDVGEFVAVSAGDTPPSVIAPTILVPITITSRFRVEPEVGYYRNSATRTDQIGSSTQTFTTTNVNLHLGAGAFGLASVERFTIYYGARVAYLRSTQSSVGSVSGSTSSMTTPGWFVAPALGGEYFIWDRLSLGAEIQVRFTSSKTSEGGSTSTVTTTTTSTHGAVVLRFYFPG